MPNQIQNSKPNSKIAFLSLNIEKEIQLEEPGRATPQLGALTTNAKINTFIEPDHNSGKSPKIDLQAIANSEGDSYSENIKEEIAWSKGIQLL